MLFSTGVDLGNLCPRALSFMIVDSSPEFNLDLVFILEKAPIQRECVLVRTENQGTDVGTFCSKMVSSRRDFVSRFSLQQVYMKSIDGVL